MILMKRKAVLVGIAAIIMVATALGLWFGLHQRCPAGYRCIRDEVAVKDGDTFHFETRSVSLPGGRSTTKVRLLGVDAPGKEQDLHRAAKDFLIGQIGLSERTVYMKVPDEPQEQLDKWGRLLALVYLDTACERTLNEMLINEGLAIIYKLPKSLRDTEAVSDTLLDAQVQAALGKKGRWDTNQQVRIAAIRYWGIPDKVVLVNRGDSIVSLEGWQLIDKNPRKDRVFGLEGEIGPGEQRSFSTSTTRHVWNDHGDTAELRDAQGNLIDTYRFEGPS
jgi:endonuclease YncB( thermonuclease family)